MNSGCWSDASGVHKEIGWSPLELTTAGAAGPLGQLAGVPVLHWHGDTFELPQGAVRLASTRLYQNQAFSWGANALALQFHPEVTVAGMELWYIGHCHEIEATPGLSVTDLRAQTRSCGPLLEQRGAGFLRQWLRTLK